MSNVKHLVTLSDHNYIINGMCLYDSLCVTSEDFVLHYLCLNQETYDQLNSLGLDNLKCYRMEELYEDPDFKTLKANEIIGKSKLNAKHLLKRLFINKINNLEIKLLKKFIF